jgi:branched-chain amino acid transport system permease protein
VRASKWAPGGLGGLLAVAAGFALVITWLVIVLLHHEQLQTTILGIPQGAFVGAVALGVTLNFRGSGVVNFSVAAMASYGAFVFWNLWQNGALFFPPPIGTLTIVSPPKGTFQTQPVAMNAWVAFGVTIAICGLMGLLFHLLIFRPLRVAPPLAKVAASIGLYLFLFSTLQIRFPNSSGYSFPSLLPQGTWRLLGVIVPQAQERSC